MKPFQHEFLCSWGFFPKTPFKGKQLSEKGAILLNKTLEPSCRLVIESIIHVSEKKKDRTSCCQDDINRWTKIICILGCWLSANKNRLLSTFANKTLEAQSALDKHIKRNINHISGVPMCNPSNHFISLLPGASKKLDSGS